MELKYMLLAASLFSVSAAARAEVCFSQDGFVIPCPPSSGGPVSSRFEVGTLPRRAGMATEIYITGGGRVEGTSNFSIYANGQFLCNTSGNPDGSNTTPVRHCTAVIAAPGTYVISASRSGSGGNFLAPPDEVINVE